VIGFGAKMSASAFLRLVAMGSVRPEKVLAKNTDCGTSEGATSRLLGEVRAL
jgi:hypothetical protein